MVEIQYDYGALTMVTMVHPFIRELIHVRSQPPRILTSI